MIQTARSWDPLYGRIDFSEFEFALIRLPEVQRLRYIRMCNINSLLVTGASEISRFEHTLGVLRLTQEWISSHKVPGSEANNLLAAAVLHDMQTGPFGHSLQYVLEDNKIEGSFTHDDIKHGQKTTYHQDTLAGATFCGKPFGAQKLLGSKWGNVASLIRGEGALGSLISGTIDLDNIDNVVRLGYHVGVANHSDADVALGLARHIMPEANGFSVPLLEMEKIQRWQEIRKDLYKLLLLDWAEFSAKAMLTRAMERAIATNLVGADSWLKTDSELLYHLEKKSVGDAQDIADIVRRLKSGELYEPIVLLETSAIEQYDRLSQIDIKMGLERELANFAKTALGLTARPIFHFILDKGKTERSVNVIVRETGESVTVGTSSKRILIGVFISKLAIKDSDAVSLTTKIKELLNSSGIVGMSTLDDPMGSSAALKNNTQLSFI